MPQPYAQTRLDRQAPDLQLVWAALPPSVALPTTIFVFFSRASLVVPNSRITRLANVNSSVRVPFGYEAAEIRFTRLVTSSKAWFDFNHTALVLGLKQCLFDLFCPAVTHLIQKTSQKCPRRRCANSDWLIELIPQQWQSPN
jgi:hypothetical protein